MAGLTVVFCFLFFGFVFRLVDLEIVILCYVTGLFSNSGNLVDLWVSVQGSLIADKTGDFLGVLVLDWC